MSDERWGPAWGALVGLAVGGVIGKCSGEVEERQRVEEEAVKAGVAEYVVIDERGNTEFRWKQPQEAERD